MKFRRPSMQLSSSFAGSTPSVSGCCPRDELGVDSLSRDLVSSRIGNGLCPRLCSMAPLFCPCLSELMINRTTHQETGIEYPAHQEYESC